MQTLQKQSDDENIAVVIILQVAEFIG